MTRVLVTSSRMPFALDEIRKLGEAGHSVVATDTFDGAPGSHSRWVETSLVTPSPRYETRSFLTELQDIIEEHDIELVLPAFEEVLFMGRYAPQLWERTRVFGPPFETALQLHEKARFLELCRSLGLNLPRTLTVTSKIELKRATEELGAFFARPVFSRGGVNLFTNTGPLAGAVKLEAVNPTPELPWVVQEFMHGHDVCSFNVVHEGHVAAHSSYIHPHMLEHAGGITFESIEDPEALEACQKVAAAVRYTGQLSIDFMRTDKGLYVVECNPRPTAGVYVMPTEMFLSSLFEPDRSQTRVAPAGRKRKISVALIRNIVTSWKNIPATIEALFSNAPDVYADPHDLVPALYQFVSYGHVLRFRERQEIAHDRRTDLMAGYFFDICWDGEIGSSPDSAYGAR